MPPSLFGPFEAKARRLVENHDLCRENGQRFPITFVDCLKDDREESR